MTPVAPPPGLACLAGELAPTPNPAKALDIREAAGGAEAVLGGPAGEEGRPNYSDQNQYLDTHQASDARKIPSALSLSTLN